MTKPDKHFFVCASFRAGGDPQGFCHKKGSLNLIPYLQEELMDRDMEGCMVSMTGCLKVCERGPAMIVYPEGDWYGGINGENDIDAILDALEAGDKAEDYLLN